MRRAPAAVLAGLAGAVAVGSVVLAFATTGSPAAIREAGRPAPLTWDTVHVAWNACAREYEFELGTSTMVYLEMTGERIVVGISGSPADGPLEAALQACLDRYRFSDPTGGYAPSTPVEQLLVAVYRDSIVENCLAAHGIDIQRSGPGALENGEAWPGWNPYFGMTGDPAEVAELRRDCPPYPGFLVPETPVR